MEIGQENEAGYIAFKRNLLRPVFLSNFSQPELTNCCVLVLSQNNKRKKSFFEIFQKLTLLLTKKSQLFHKSCSVFIWSIMLWAYFKISSLRFTLPHSLQNDKHVYITTMEIGSGVESWQRSKGYRCNSVSSERCPASQLDSIKQVLPKVAGYGLVVYLKARILNVFPCKEGRIKKTNFLVNYLVLYTTKNYEQ